MRTRAICRCPFASLIRSRGFSSGGENMSLDLDDVRLESAIPFARVAVLGIGAVVLFDVAVSDNATRFVDVLNFLMFSVSALAVSGALAIVLEKAELTDTFADSTVAALDSAGVLSFMFALLGAADHAGVFLGAFLASLAALILGAAALSVARLRKPKPPA